MVLQDGFCQNCGKKYTDVYCKWCKPCQIDNLKENFTTSGNEKIDNFIQEMQLKIDKWNDIVFEWIPYNQYTIDIKEIGKDDFITLHSAIWKDGPLNYHSSSRKYTRSLYRVARKVTLKCLHNSQNITNEFLNEV